MKLENAMTAMTKEVQMSFRVEPDLRAEFTQATERDHRPAAQVLREFMRRYVQEDRERVAAQRASGVVIDAAARLKRQDAVNFARASVGLEGFKLTDEYEALTQRFINGEIEFSDLTQAVDEQARRR